MMNPEQLKTLEEVPLRRLDGHNANLAVACLHPVTGSLDILVLHTQYAVPGGGILKFQFVKERTFFYVSLEKHELSRKGPFVSLEVNADSQWLIVSGGGALVRKANDAGRCLLVDLSQLTGDCNTIQSSHVLEIENRDKVLQTKRHPENQNLVGILQDSGFLELRKIDRRWENEHMMLGPNVVDFAFVPVTEIFTQVIVIALDKKGALTLHFTDSLTRATQGVPPLSLLPSRVNKEKSAPWVSVATLLAGELCLFVTLQSDGKVECVGCSGAALLSSRASGSSMLSASLVDALQLGSNSPLTRLVSVRDSPPDGPVVLAYGPAEAFALQFPWVAQLSRAATESLGGLLSPPPLIPTTAAHVVKGDSFICGMAGIRNSATFVRGKLAQDLPSVSGLSKSTDWASLDELQIESVDLLPVLVNKSDIMDFRRLMKELWNVADEGLVGEGTNSDATETVPGRVAEHLVRHFLKELKEVQEENPQNNNNKLFNIKRTHDCPISINAVLSSLEVSAARVGRVASLVEHLKFMTERLRHVSPSVPEITSLPWQRKLDRINRLERTQNHIREKTQRVLQLLQQRLEDSVNALICMRYLPVLITGSEKAADHIASLLTDKYDA